MTDIDDNVLHYLQIMYWRTSLHKQNVPVGCKDTKLPKIG